MNIIDIKNTLYGDGIHDDYPALQELLDSRAATISLPVPKVCYSIGHTLRIHANQTFELPSNTVIRLLPQSNCLMIKNDREDGHERIKVTGGIWDMNNQMQEPNPIYTRSVNLNFNEGAYADNEYLGVAIRFLEVHGLSVSNLCIKDPVTFGVQLAKVEEFTIENISFDYNHGNPYAINMDGVHLDGYCRFGMIRNLKGTCYDDLLALNADDFLDGPIEDIAVDGLFAKECHSAVRLLSSGSNVRRIHITNVFGSYYQYCIGITKFYSAKGPLGYYDQICLSNIYAEKYPRQDFHHKSKQKFEYDIIWIESNLQIKNLQIQNVHRRESRVPTAMVHVNPNTCIEVLSLEHLSQENETETPMSILKNEGTIQKLYMYDLQTDETIVDNTGSIQNVQDRS